MALFYAARLRVTDSDGVPIPGGSARFRNAGTVTLTDLFSDQGLTTPLTNPVEAGSTGWTPQIFAAEGTTCDIQFFDASDVEVPDQSFEDVVALGADTGTFSRTFAGGTRMKISDSGGVIITEYGDAYPDNTGGSSKEQGWSGTQGDTKTFNFANVNAGTSAGALKENNKKLPAHVETDLTAFSTSTGLVVALTESPANVRQWEIEFIDLVAAGTVAMTCQLSFDNGATYKSGAGDYIYTKWIMDNTAGPGIAVSPSTGDTKIDVAYALRAPANKAARMTVKITTPESGTEHTLVESEGTACDRTATTSLARFGTSGSCVGSYGRATHVKFLQGANLISGSYRVTTLRASGDA